MVPRLLTSLALGLIITIALAWASARWNQIVFTSFCPVSTSPPGQSVAFILNHWEGPAGQRVSLAHFYGGVSKPDDPDFALRAMHSAAADLLHSTTKENLWPWWTSTPDPQPTDILWAGEVQDARGWPLPAFRSKWLIECTRSTPGPLTTAGRAPFANVYHLHGGLELPLIEPMYPARDSTLRALPLIPIWRGLLLDTLLFAAIIAIVHSSVRALRSHLRRRRGHCPRCNYDLLHNVEAGCSECGWNRAQSVPPS